MRFLRLYTLLFMFVLAVIPQIFAASFEEKYGKELKSVPYYIRVAYADEYGVPWSDASYDERYAYLDRLQQEEFQAMIDKQARDSAEQLDEANRQMQRQLKKQAEIQKKFDKDMLKANQKISEANKKNAYLLKSLAQKQKLMMLRQSSSQGN